MTNQFAVPSETVEAGLLNACSSMEQWLELSGFTDEDFTSHREVFRFMGSYLSQYSSLPSQAQISSRFDWQPPPGDFRYWLTEMKRYSTSRKALTVITTGYEQVKNGKPIEAITGMLEQLSLIRAAETNHIKSSDADIQHRYEKYLERTQFLFSSGEMIGLPTGMKIIDNTRQGWMTAGLVGCYARPGLGKTWWISWQGIISWLGGKTVLAITPEMPSNMFGLRLDVLWANQLGYPIDYGKLLIGDPSIKENYDMIRQIVGQSNRWWNYSSLNDRGISMGDIAALARQHEPDIILIDGVSLLRYEGRQNQGWERMLETMYGLKNLATIHEVPVIVTHQSVNRARGRNFDDTIPGRGDDFVMPSLNDAAYGDAFVQACGDIITMVGDPDQPNVLWYSLRKTRERGWQQALPQRMAFFVDYGHGRIIDLGEFGYDKERVGQEVQRLMTLGNVA